MLLHKLVTDFDRYLQDLKIEARISLDIQLAHHWNKAVGCRTAVVEYPPTHLSGGVWW